MSQIEVWVRLERVEDEDTVIMAVEQLINGQWRETVTKRVKTHDAVIFTIDVETLTSLAVQK